MIFLLVAAALVAGAPLVAAVLVSVASVREDAAKSLAGHPPGALASLARRLLRARMGGSGPAQGPVRVIEPLPGREPPWQPWGASQIEAPQWADDDDEGPDRSYGALATPRG